MTIHARLRSDGLLYEISDRPKTYPDDVELDSMPAGMEPHMRDPTNPRRAIPHTVLIAAQARQERMNYLIDLEARRAAAERLAARGIEGMAEERDRLAKEIAP